MRRYAVVVGVDRTGELPPLRDAAAGAARIAEWLRAEGFQTDLITDEAGPVRAATLFARVNAVCMAGVYDQLLVYFSGHGYLNDSSEHWLLSDAPLNANEAVSLEENIHLARDCGVPNVIFVSDACRSTPQSLKADRMRGSLIFPNLGVSSTQRADVDRLYACLPGDSAFEVSVDTSVKQYRALYSSCLQGAFTDTAAAFCRTIGNLEVLPTRGLKKLMPALLDTAATKASVTLFQKPDTIVESDDDVYIARVSRTPQTDQGDESEIGGSRGRAEPARQGTASPGGPLTARQFRTFRTGTSRNLDFSRMPSPIPVLPDSDADVDSLRKWSELLVADMLGPQKFPGGFPIHNRILEGAIRASSDLPDAERLQVDRAVTVRGAEVVDVRGIGCEAVLAEAGGKGQDALVRVSAFGAAAGSTFPETVLLRFGDGGGTALAVPEGYICAVRVDGEGGSGASAGGVVQVAYTPAPASARFRDYADHRASIEIFRALAGGLARMGAFRIERRQASSLAARVRYGGLTDPTSALYAAYAFIDVGLAQHVEALAAAVGLDPLGHVPFDIALLARAEHRRDRTAVSPFCPMLSRGWQLLRVFGEELPPIVAEAGFHRRASLWTTFDEKGMDLLFTEQGDP